MLRYAITDGSQSGCNLQSKSNALLVDVERWAQDGLDYVQLREKSLGAADLLALAQQVLQVLRQYGDRTKLLINSRCDVAIASGAHGVHLATGPSELTLDQVRLLYREINAEPPFVSISCHTMAEVEQAHANKADLILFGPVFEKQVGGEAVLRGVGLDRLREACIAAQGTRVFALGGITNSTAEACLAVRAAGVAGIRLFGRV